VTLHVLFRVAETRYLVPASEVLLLESFSGVTKVPGAPPHVAGVVQVRNAVVPVVDLRARFALPPAASAEARVVVVRHEGRTVGLLVDEARSVLRVDASAAEPAPELTVRESAGCVHAMSKLGDTWALHLDIGRVVGPESIDGHH
jgi:purine-binding chemotaxis protein CheW